MEILLENSSIMLLSFFFFLVSHLFISLDRSIFIHGDDCVHSPVLRNCFIQLVKHFMSIFSSLPVVEEVEVTRHVVDSIYILILRK